MRTFFAIFLCLPLVAGCKKSTNNQPPPTTTCSADTDCKSDERCLAGSCVPTSCGDHPCHAGQGCVSGECLTADCVGVTCGAGQGCALGQCYPLSCGATACAPGDVCVQGTCTFAGCAQKACAQGALCADGRCLPVACNGGTCAQGAVCDVDHCVAAPCIGLTCPSGTTCVQGVCASSTCGDGGACPSGQACLDGACAEPTCAGLTCPGGSRCQSGSCVACPAHESTCSDGVDDDCDGLTDCADPDCDGKDCAPGKTCKAGVCAVEPCGNGTIDPGEDCDDGNRLPGDGCSPSCHLECGWTCTGAPSFCTAEDLIDFSTSIAAAIGTGTVHSLAVSDDALYVGGDSGKLVRLGFDSACTPTDLTPRLASFWGAGGSAPAVNVLAWDAGAGALYLGGDAFGAFALYHPPGWSGSDPRYSGADQAWDLSGKHALVTKPWAIVQLVVDATGGAVYLAANDTDGCTSAQDSPSFLLRYKPAADSCDMDLNNCANRCASYPDACAVDALALDDAGRALWAAGRADDWTGLHKLDLATGTFQESFSTNLSSDWPRALAFDATGSALYLTGTQYGSTTGGDFLRFAPATSEVTALTGKLTALWGAGNGDLNDMYALALDPQNHVVYVGGNLAKLASYRTPDNARSPDSASLISITGGATSWTTEAVRALLYDKAGFVWIAGDNGRLVRLRAKQ